MTYRLLPMTALLLALTAGAEPLRDPFQRPVTSRPTAAIAAAAAEPVKPPRLRALVLGGARSLANIDGQVLAAGEQFSGYTVLRIDARGALLVRAGSEVLLTIQDKDPQ